MSDNVVVLHDTRISDIPGMLRKLADAFEAGEETAPGLLVVIPQDGDFPAVFGYGEHLGDYGNIALLEMAKVFMVNHLTERA